MGGLGNGGFEARLDDPERQGLGGDEHAVAEEVGSHHMNAVGHIGGQAHGGLEQAGGDELHPAGIALVDAA